MIIPRKKILTEKYTPISEFEEILTGLLESCVFERAGDSYHLDKLTIKRYKQSNRNMDLFYISSPSETFQKENENGLLEIYMSNTLESTLIYIFKIESVSIEQLHKATKEILERYFNKKIFLSSFNSRFGRLEDDEL